MKSIIARGFIACLIGLYPTLSLAQTHPGDSLELVSFYNNNCNDGCTLGWDFSESVETWTGVNIQDGRVDGLLSVNHGLSGELQNLNLPELTVLVITKGFGGEELIGTLPNFSNLPNLTLLDLSGNQLSGEIPIFDHLTSIERIYLLRNAFTGSIPNLSILNNLQTLDLSFNLLSGCYSDELSFVCGIYSYNFSNNPGLPGNGNFDAFCDIGFGSCSASDYINVNDSLELIKFYEAACLDCPLEWDFSQPVSTWGNILLQEGSVIMIDLEDVGLNGSLCDLNLPSLERLLLRENHLKGGMPNLNLPLLTDLDLYSNNFEDTIPSFNLPVLERLDLSGNDFTGSIPQFDMPNLRELSLGSNDFLSSIPDFNLPKLENLDMRSAGVIGVIPNFDLPLLIELDLSTNNLEGTIPNFSNLTNVEHIYLDKNNLSGAIPNFPNLPNLSILHVERNNLNGSIPDFDGTPELFRIYAYRNELTGTIPNFSNLPRLQVLDLSYNNINGNIPSFDNCEGIRNLNLSNNYLTGQIPDFESNSLIYHIILHNNRLRGYIGIQPKDYYAVTIQGNYFSFDDVQEPYLENIEMSYSPQYHGESQYFLTNQGDNLDLTLSSPIQGDNNDNVEYHWKKNDEEILNATDSVFTIENLQIEDVGAYTLHMTDSTRVPGLEIISEPIYVVLPGYDLTGEPVAYNELIMEFDDWEDKTRYEEEYLFPNAGVLTDSCSCNRLLYLWQFPNDTSALSILIDINTKTESQENEADVDGGLNNIIDAGALTSGAGWTWTGEYTDNYPHPVTIYQLDSGSEITNSPHLLEEAPVDACYDIPKSSGYDYADTLNAINGDFRDELGHGTYGFGSITEGLSDYMDVNVVPLKVFNESGQGTLFNFICALYHAVDHDADIINVSAGYSGQPSGILEKAIATAYEKGIFIVTATGNDGVNIDETPQYPAFYAAPDTVIHYDDNIPPDTIITITHYDNVISVASINLQDKLSDFSNFGQQAAILSAYGEDMGGFDHTGERVSSSGSSVSTYYVTRQLAAEMARDTSRSYEQIWLDFENSSLRDCPATSGLTKTGKCLDITLDSACCGASGETIVQFSIFPNPTNYELNVELELTEAGDSAKISLYDANGKLLLEEETESLSFKERLILNISTFPAGVYFLKLEVGGYPLIHKIVKY